MKWLLRGVCIAVTAAVSLVCVSCAASPTLGQNDKAVAPYFEKAAAKLDAVQNVTLFSQKDIVMHDGTALTNIHLESNVVQHIDAKTLSVSEKRTVDGKTTTAQLFLVNDGTNSQICYMQDADGNWAVSPDASRSTYLLGQAFYSPTMFAFYRESASAFRYVRDDVRNGLNCTVVEATITGEGMRIVSDHVGLVRLLQDALCDTDEQTAAYKQSWEDAWDDVLANAPQLGVTVTGWIVEHSALPVRYTVDMTEVGNALLRAQARATTPAESPLPEMRRFTFDLSLKQYNQSPPVTVPDEALQAAAMVFPAA